MARLALLALTLLVAGSAGAAPPTPAAPARTAARSSEARALFDAGRAALTTGRFAEARDLFQRSLALVPKAGSAFNLAVALRGTGEARAAIATLDRLLEGAYGSLHETQRSEAEALRTQARADVAILRLDLTGPAALALRVDGRAVERPAGGTLEVDAGTHVIEASAPAHRTVEARVQVARGATADVVLVLEPLALTGTVIIEAEPEDRVRVVGVAEATGNLERALDPGHYRLEAEGPSGKRTMDAEVVAGQTLRVRLPREEASFPWPWVGLGVALATAGAVITVLVVTSGPEPIVDPTYGVIQTLRGR